MIARSTTVAQLQNQALSFLEGVLRSSNESTKYQKIKISAAKVVLDFSLKKHAVDVLGNRSSMIEIASTEAGPVSVRATQPNWPN